MIIFTNRVHPYGGGAAKIRELRIRVAAAVGGAMFGPSSAPVIARGPAADGDEVAGAGTTSSVTTATASSVMPMPGPVRVGSVVRTGLDTLAEQDFAPFQGHAVGLVTNQTGIDALGRRNIDLFATAPGVRLQAIFSPEHGITGLVDADVPNGRDPTTGKPIWSLYGPTRRPTPEMLRGVSVLVFDVQDLGVRYYTYLTTLIYVLEEAAKRSIPVVVRR
jgi:uncharacterized protein YbbC (DUF1343 family)